MRCHVYSTSFSLHCTVFLYIFEETYLIGRTTLLRPT